MMRLDGPGRPLNPMLDLRARQKTVRAAKVGEIFRNLKPQRTVRLIRTDLSDSSSLCAGILHLQCGRISLPHALYSYFPLRHWCNSELLCDFLMLLDLPRLIMRYTSIMAALHKPLLHHACILCVFVCVCVCVCVRERERERGRQTGRSLLSLSL